LMNGYTNLLALIRLHYRHCNCFQLWLPVAPSHSLLQR
jgi:hypothetical protein